MNMNCPLCNASESRPSWLDRVFFEGVEFRYRECLSCRSLYCDPMPDEATLSRMYGPQYSAGFANGHATVRDPKEPLRVVDWLRTTATGTFVDYGCGDGALLSKAAALNWKAIGVEFDDQVSAATARRTGAQVITVSQLESLPPQCVDVLHLGDVIEHLTELGRQMPSILKLIRPGGLLLAQGPLEANANLFTFAVRLGRRLRRARRTEMAPYHVLLATASGQRRFFKHFGLQEVEYAVREVAWPAPARLSWSDCVKTRPAGLFLLRRLSQSISALRPARWGNRYFYAGRRSNDA